MAKKQVKIVNGVRCVSLTEEELYKRYRKEVLKRHFWNGFFFGKRGILVTKMETPSFEEWRKNVVQTVSRVNDNGTTEILYDKAKSSKEWWEE